jgi:hypothetical protein
MAIETWLGSGHVSLRVYGSTVPFQRVGNCSRLEFNLNETTIEQRDFTSGGGGTYDEVRRIESVEMGMTLHDLNTANLARVLYADTSSVASAAVSNELKVANLDRVIALAKMPLTITSVKSQDDVTTYVAGDDYSLSGAGIYIPAGSSIPEDATVKVSYTCANYDVIEALTTTGLAYELMFEGLNEGGTNKRGNVHVYRVRIGAAQGLNWIGEDFAALEVTGKLLKDPTKSGAGKSTYFRVEKEKAA